MEVDLGSEDPLKSLVLYSVFYLLPDALIEPKELCQHISLYSMETVNINFE